MPFETRYHAVPPADTDSFRSMTPWAKWVFIMMFCSSFGKTFYYLGIPAAKIFIGDITLGLFFVLRTRELASRWFGALTGRNVLSPFAWVLLLSVLFGIVEVLYGLHSGYSLLTALQNLVFNLYPVYFFLSLWVGSEHPTMLQKVIRWWAWTLALYGPAYLLVLNKIKWFVPGTDGVPLFPQAGGGGMFLLSLLALERRPSRFWLPMVMCAFMMLAAQVRSEWLSTIIGFVLWGLLERKFARVAQAFTLIAALLVIGFVLDVDLPSTSLRGGAVSSREIVARGLSAVSPSLAQEYTASKNTAMYAGTISWRTRWWSAIWDSVSPEHSLVKAAFGNGYGFPLKDLVPYLRAVAELRTPHSIFYFALGYSGWIGVLLFFGLQAALFKMLWRVYKLTGQSWGIVAQTMTVVGALFGNSLESPMEAIPFYLLMGLFIGPVLCRSIIVIPAGTPRVLERQPQLATARQLTPESL